MTLPADLRIAVVHEWIDSYAGSEQVFEAIARLYPTADLFALSKEPGVDLDVGPRPVECTFLDRPSLRHRRGASLPLMPLAWRLLGRRDYDLVISSHHAFAHANRLAGPGGVHLSYVHSPARYVWSPEIDGRGAGPHLAAARAVLKRMDRRYSTRVSAYAANSATVARRIEKYWSRESTVLHPPVRTDFFAEPASAPPTRDYVLGFGRWISYKNLPAVVEAGDRAGLPVKIAGSGPEEQAIRAACDRAGVECELIRRPSDEHLRELYRNAACLVFPTIEDFGIIPVEAQASGTPVVALSVGGTAETVRHGTTGILVDSPDPDLLADGIRAARDLDPAACADWAATFGPEHFARRFRQWVGAQWLRADA